MRGDDERIEVVGRAIKQLDARGAKDKLRSLAKAWKLDQRDASFEAQTMHMFATLGVDPDDNMLDDLENDRGSFGLKSVDEKVNQYELEAIGLYHRLHELGLFPREGDDDPAKRETLRTAVKIIETVFYAKRVVLSAFQAKLAIHQFHVDEGVLDLDKDLDARLGSWALRFRFIDSDITGFQNLLLYLLDSAMEKRYRKSNGWLYEPVILDGRDTHSWKPVVEIKDFVYSSLRKETCWEQWKNATQNMKNVASSIEYLTNCHDYQLPELVKQRGVYAFKNGVYLADRDHFHRFDSGDALHDSIVACKFVDADFAPCDDWRDVPTPSLDSIMKYQEWPEDVCDWCYAMLGRMLYPLNRFDSWQVIPFFKGLAATGKCFSRDSPIMMHDGSIRPVQDIRVGDEVMGDDGSPRRILTLARGVDEMFDIVPKNSKFPTYTVTREHVLCLKYSNQGSVGTWKYGKKVSWFDHATKKCRVTKFTHENEQALADFVEVLDRDRTFEMTVAEYMDLPKYARRYMKAYRVAVDFPARPDPAFDPWCIGAWLGGGDSAGPRVTSADQEIVDGFVGALAGTETEIKADKTRYRYSVTQKGGTRSKNGNALTAALRAYGLQNNKHIPADLKFGSRATRMAVLAGLLDTDGYFDGGRGYEITQKREVLADDIAFVARSLGFAATKTEVVKGCVHDGTLREGTYFRVNVFGDGLDDLPVRLARKRCDGRRRNKNAMRYGFDVLPAGRQRYYGFETDGNHRFLLGDFTVTHNSTIILKVCKNFFDPTDVGILSNNIERKFGISAFYDKYLVVAPEVRNDLCIEQAEFQSIVSGEDVQVNVKHKKAFSVEWSVPGALAGNEVPSWADSAGSIQRRIVLFEFKKPVRHGDTKLGDKLNAELHAIIQKCNKAYLEKVKRHGHENVWSVLPKYFVSTRDALAQATNSIEGFLSTPDVRVGEDQWCPMDDFKSALKEYEIKNSIPSKRYSNDLFIGPFEKLGLVVCRDTRNYRGVERYRDYVVGVDVNIHVAENALG